MNYKDYYDVLGLSRGVTTAEMKRAYQKPARSYHPYVGEENNAEERFKEVSEEYESLKDPDRRNADDQLGSRWRDGVEFTPPRGRSMSRDPHHFESSDTGFGDFFDSILGRQDADDRHENFHMRGSEHTVVVSIDMEGSFRGLGEFIELHDSGAPLRRLKFEESTGIIAG